MRIRKRPILITLLLAILFTLLFYKKELGLNLLIFEACVLAFTFPTVKKHLKSINGLLVFGTLVVSAFATILVHSTFAYLMNFFLLFLWSGYVLFPQAKSLVNTVLLSGQNLVLAQIASIQNITYSIANRSGIGIRLYRYRIFLVPAAIIFVFILMYRAANPVFDGLVAQAAFLFDNALWDALFHNINFLMISTFFLGCGVAALFAFGKKDPQLEKADREATDTLKRKRVSGKKFAALGLKNEYKAAIFLFAALNLLLLVLNITDIHWVWLNFEWEGQYLKQFVHAGTYLLILSILISIALVLFFFRRNLNFLSNNRVLKVLCYIWLIQNAILCISVAIRNAWYINYFSLAYKRIGVFIFLALTLYGLYTVFKKVHGQKTAFYLFRFNIAAWILVLFVASNVNWDGLIVRYNLKHADRGFLHLNYLATMSNKTLPYLNISLQDLERIDAYQKKKFPVEDHYLTPLEFDAAITKRIEKFNTSWEQKTWLEWNLPEQMAYNKLH